MKIEGFIVKTVQARVGHGCQAALDGVAADGHFLDMAGQFCRGGMRRAAGFVFYFRSGFGVEIESSTFIR